MLALMTIIWMSRKVVLCVLVCCCVSTAATAEQSPCRYFKVQVNSLNVSKEPRGDSVFIDMLDKGEVVCVTRDEKSGGKDWGYVADKVVKPNDRPPVGGWIELRPLQPLSPAEIAAVTGTPAPAVAAPSPPADDVLRFSQPVPFGPFPVNGNSIEKLADAIPQFPPFDGLDENQWKKNCSSCHKWERQALCEQGASYAKNPRNALRHPHPYGGAYKSALMQWAKGGCQ
jgi:hypothetical protein